MMLTIFDQFKNDTVLKLEMPELRYNLKRPPDQSGSIIHQCCGMNPTAQPYVLHSFPHSLMIT